MNTYEENLIFNHLKSSGSATLGDLLDGVEYLGVTERELCLALIHLVSRQAVVFTTTGHGDWTFDNSFSLA